MAAHSRIDRPPFTFRRRFIDEADRLLAIAKAAVARAEVACLEEPAWAKAGEAFEQAGRLYRRAALGMLARHTYEQASHCYGWGGLLGDAQRCGEIAATTSSHCQESPTDRNSGRTVLLAF